VGVLGGGWATKNARCGKQGSKEAWGSRSSRGRERYKYGRVHGPRMSELGPRAG